MDKILLDFLCNSFDNEVDIGDLVCSLICKNHFTFPINMKIVFLVVSVSFLCEFEINLNYEGLQQQKRTKQQPHFYQKRKITSCKNEEIAAQ